MHRFIVFVACLIIGTAAWAVDNTVHAVGVGVGTQFVGAETLSRRPIQLAAKFALQPRAELSALLGVKAASTGVFTPGVKFAWVLIPEKHMNLYVAASASLDLRTRGGLTAFLWHMGPGVELFLSEWPNLGLSLEFGVGGDVRPGTVQSSTGPFATTATGFGGAGLHYYF